MPEETGQVAAPVEGTTPTPVAVPLADAEGNLREGWTESLDEDIRGEPSIASMKNIKGIVKTFIHAQRMVGRDKIVRPTESSSEEDWNEFYKAGGRPETPTEYGFTKPEDMPDEVWDEDGMKEVMEHFHKLGLSKKQAQAIFEFNTNKINTILKAKVAQEELDTNKLKDGLVSDWGPAYDQKLHLGNLAIQKATEGDDGLKERVVAKYGNDPDLIRAFANIGGKFAEDGVIETTSLPTTFDIEQQIGEGMRHGAYMDWQKNGFTMAEHNAQLEKVNKLIELKGKFKKG